MHSARTHEDLIGKRFASDTRTVEVVHHGERRPKLCTVRIVTSQSESESERVGATGQMLVRDVLAMRPVSGGRA